MPDLLYSATLLTQAIFICLALYMSYRVGKLVPHAPLGWNLLVASFALALVDLLYYLFAAYITPLSPYLRDYFGVLLTTPFTVAIFAGVYYLHRDFDRLLRERQASTLVPQG